MRMNAVFVRGGSHMSAAATGKPVRSDGARSAALSMEMPYSVELERAVLSGMCSDSDIALRGVAELCEEDFYGLRNRSVFSAVKSLVDRGRDVDPFSVRDVLRAERGDAGGAEQIVADILTSSAVSGHWDTYVASLRRYTFQRRLKLVAAQLIGMASDPPSDLADLVAAAEGVFFSAVDEGTGTDGPKDMSTLAEEAFVRYGMLGREDDAGVKTGFAELDAVTGNWRPGELFVLGARPSVGKSAFALSLALNVANAGNRVFFVSLEMTAEQIVDRAVSISAGVPNSLFKGDRVPTSGEYNSLVAGLSKLDGLDFYIADTSLCTVSQIRSHARRVMRGVEKGRGLVVLDYLQLVQGEPERRFESRQVLVAEVSRACKVLARDIGCPVLVLSQLNRDVDKRDDKRPLLSDLRESGAIEQDADVVMLLDRSKDREEAMRDDRPDWLRADLNVAKHRAGGLGHVTLDFDPETTGFNSVPSWAVNR